jgi:oligopeptide/dipeptide ABC transporter ATP-binding protein
VSANAGGLTPALVDDGASPDVGGGAGAGSGRTLLGTLHRPGALFGTGVLLGWLPVAALAPLIAPASPTAPSAGTLLAPSAAHWFGTDELGRDVLSRVIYGARLSLPLALLLVALASTVGTSIGAFAGFAGGVLDSVVMRVTDMFFAFPGIVLTMAFAAALGPSLQSAVLAIVIVSWPPYARVVRGLVLAMRGSNYVAVSRLLGGSNARWPHEFSGGLRQRIAIAIALACEPKILLADEPTTALDVTVQAEILRLLRELVDERQVSVILISHDLGVVSSLADRVQVMYAGRVVESGRREQVIASPRHPYTRALLAALPGGAGPRSRIQAIPGSPPLPGHLPAGCAFHPRCGFAVASCTSSRPAFAPVEGGTRLACPIDPFGPK